jgi:hypothetical protein
VERIFLVTAEVEGSPANPEVTRAHAIAPLRRPLCKPQANRERSGTAQLRDARFNRRAGRLNDYSPVVTRTVLKHSARAWVPRGSLKTRPASAMAEASDDAAQRY